MNIREDSSFIKGLLEGLTVDTSKPEGKLISALVDVIDKMALEIEQLKSRVDTCSDYIEELDEDLGFVEELIYDDDDDCCDDDCDCCCDDDCCDCCDDDDDCDCGEFYETICDGCGEKYYFDEDADPEDVVCPSCKKPLIDDDDEENTEE